MVKGTILIVDDSSDFLALMEMLLMSQYIIIKARDGHQGLMMAQSKDPDLIILDMNMPRMNGIQMLAALRDTTCNAPVIFVTAAGSEHLAAKAFRLGVYDYLIKPFEGNILEESINRALSKTRLAREKNELEDVLVTAGATCQTVATLTQRINNQMIIVNGGLSLMKKNMARPGGLSTYESTETILRDCLNSTNRIQAALREMEKITRVDLTTYYEEENMADVNNTLQKALASIQKNAI